MNKLREIPRNERLLLTLCSERNSFDFATFFDQTAEPSVLLAPLVKAEFGDFGAGLLTGILTSSLYRTALRLQGRGGRSCVLAIDEVIVAERLLGPQLVEILVTARSLGLRACLSFQYLKGISDELRTALFGNLAWSLAFAMDYEDAKHLASAVATGNADTLLRAELQPIVDKATGDIETMTRAHPIEDQFGERLRLSPWVTPDFESTDGRAQIAALYRLCAPSGRTRLYVRDPHAHVPVELYRYVSALDPEDFWLTTPRLHLVVQFARPKVSGVEKTTDADLVRQYTRLVQDLPVQHSLARIAGEAPHVVRIKDIQLSSAPAVPGPSVNDLTAEVERLVKAREAGIARVCRGLAPFPERHDFSQTASPENDNDRFDTPPIVAERAEDGSLW